MVMYVCKCHEQIYKLQWHHNERDDVSNDQRHDCLSRRRSKTTSNLRVTGLCEGNSPATDEFPAPRASNTENVSIWWRHHIWPMTRRVVSLAQNILSLAGLSPCSPCTSGAVSQDLWTHNPNLATIFIALPWKIISRSRHNDSSVLVTCAKLLFYVIIRGTTKTVFTSFRLWAHKPFKKCVPVDPAGGRTSTIDTGQRFIQISGNIHHKTCNTDNSKS